MTNSTISANRIEALSARRDTLGRFADAGAIDGIQAVSLPRGATAYQVGNIFHAERSAALRHARNRLAKALRDQSTITIDGRLDAEVDRLAQEDAQWQAYVGGYAG